MAHVTDEAICIRHWDFSETSQTVSLFCRGHGVLRGLAKGAKRAGGRFSGGIDLLTRGQVVAIVKPGRELSTLTDWALLATYRSLRSRLMANQSAYYMIDLVQRLVADGDPHPRLYDGLVACLEAIDAPSEPEGDGVAVQLAFQWLALDEAGYRPALADPDDPDAELPQTVHFSAEAGGIARGGGWKVRRPTIELLRSIAMATEAVPDAEGARASLAECLDDAVKAGPDVTVRANRLLASYLRHVLGQFPETMRALFADL
ncbi:MAG: DNA repair protein RecO [Phycisphaerae bacterium]|nr:DNA repair protein RecO [Phycisphaerae bacterium]